jgi:hypothetical protein
MGKPPINTTLDYYNNIRVNHPILVLKTATREEYEDWCTKMGMKPHIRFNYFYWYTTD